MPQEDTRRTADVFLKLIEKSRRGKLKIYIGHAAGVGKTYQMLEDAHISEEAGRRRRRRPHRDARPRGDGGEGRPASRRFRGAGSTTRAGTLEEMDLPAILRRKPEVVIVDELAHTNVAGTENSKRYEDVEDLLDAGHLRHDGRQHPALRVRAGHRLARDRRGRAGAGAGPDPAPGRRGRERRPAVGGAAPAAASPGRSTRPTGSSRRSRTSSRRRTSRRCASSRCGRSPTASRRSGGGPTSSRSRETVGTKAMVAISSNPETTRRLLRRASALAGRLNTNWFAVYVRTPRESPQRMSARDHRLLNENVTLAMELGARVVWLSAEDVAAELLRFAREHGITLAIFGKSRRPSWRRAHRRRSPIERFAAARDRHRRLRDRDGVNQGGESRLAGFSRAPVTAPASARGGGALVADDEAAIRNIDRNGLSTPATRSKARLMEVRSRRSPSGRVPLPARLTARVSAGEHGR